MPARPPGGDQVDLVVEVAGELTLPEELLARLRLTTGDLIAVESGRLSVRLDLYREFLASDWEGLSPESVRHLVEEYLRQSLTAVLPGGRLSIPRAALALEVGDRLVLEARAAGLHHEIFLFRDAGHVEI